jgi:3-hydroxybutyryl-CoA dehydrogenase
VNEESKPSSASDDAGGIRTVAVIGAGAAGRGFAVRCAVAGFEVVLEDVMPANLRRAEEELSAFAAGDTGGAFRFASRIEDAVREADVVVDFVPDELESKLEIFCLIDRMAPPKTLIVTPSDAMSITDLSSCTYRGDRCFAVRGGWVKDAGGPVRLLHPANAFAENLATVQAFLLALGDEVRVETDQDAPMLTKNLS